MYSVKEIYYTLQGEGAQTGRAAVFLRFAGCNLWSGREKDRATAICRFCDTDFADTDGPGGGKFASAEELAAAIEERWRDGSLPGLKIVSWGTQGKATAAAPPKINIEQANGGRVPPPLRGSASVFETRSQGSAALHPGLFSALPPGADAVAHETIPIPFAGPERSMATQDDEGERKFVVCTGGEPLLQLDAALIDALHRHGFEIAVETNGTIEAPAGLDWICVSPKAGAELKQRSGDELKLVYPQAGAEPAQFEGLNFRHFSLQPMDGPHREANTQAAIHYCLEHPRWRLSLQTHKVLGIP